MRYAQIGFELNAEGIDQEHRFTGRVGKIEASIERHSSGALEQAPLQSASTSPRVGERPLWSQNHPNV
jgi:hypothetical protein